MKKIISIIVSCTLLLTALVLPSGAENSALQQDFENGYTLYSSVNSEKTTHFEQYTAPNDGDELVHGGKNSLKHKGGQSGTHLVNLSDGTNLVLENGKTYAITFWLKVIAYNNATTGTQELRLFDGAYSSAWNGNWASSLDCRLPLNNGVAAKGWQQYSFNYITQSGSGNTYLKLYATGSYEFYLDDITAVEKKEVTVRFDTNGGNSLSAIMGKNGDEMTLPADPQKEECVFEGWYWDAALTQLLTEKVFPNNDATLYAKWNDGSIVYGYEDEAAVFDVANATAAVSAEQKSEGNTSLKVAATGGATLGWLRLSPTNNTSLKLTVGKRYLVSIDVYTTVAINDFRFGGAGAKWQLNGTNPPNSYIKNNLPGKAEWQTVTGEFVAGAETLHLYYNFSGKAFTAFYLDHLRLKEIAPKVQTTVEYNDETVRLTDLNGDELGLVKANNTLQFKALCANGVTPVVKAGSATLTADENGVYSYEVGESNFTLTVSGSGMTAAQNHAVGVGLNGEDLTTYNAEVFSAPLWQGSTSYQEAAMFFNTIDGQQCFEKSLAYPIDDVVSVRSANLKTYYIKGVDYKIENGKLIWLENGKMPIYQSALAVPRNADDAYDDPTLADHGNVKQADWYYIDDEKGLYLMWDGYHENSTVYVTYTHSKTWADLGQQGYTPTVPEAQGNKLGSLYSKLAGGGNINVLVYGDSTATGAASSGAQMNYDLFDRDGKVQPRSAGTRINAPTFFEQATAKMVQEYGIGNPVTYYNIALGGTGSGWGKTELQNRVDLMNAYYGKTVVPDVIYVKYTANDEGAGTNEETLAAYKANMSGIVSQFKKLYPNASIVLVSGKVNNKKSAVYSNLEYLLQMENALVEIAAENADCIVARGSSQFVQLVKSKDVEDYLSNNINHANDFWAKTMGQVIAASMSKTVQPGDVNGDDAADLKDVLLLTRYALGSEVELNARMADVNSDGSIDLKDAVYLAQHLAGWKDRPLHTVTGTFTAVAEQGTNAGYVKTAGSAFTAVAFHGNEFLGWFNESGELQSKNSTVSQKDMIGNLTARFKDNNLLSEIGGGYEVHSAPKVYNGSKGEEVPTDKPGFYSSTVFYSMLNGVAYSGAKSFALMTRWQNPLISVPGLEKNTQYAVSFKVKLNTLEGGARFEGMRVAPTSIKKFGDAANCGIGGFETTIAGDTDWHEVTFNFNTGDLTAVNLTFFYVAADKDDKNNALNIDELTMWKLPNQESYKQYSVTAAAENGLAYTNLISGGTAVQSGSSVIFTCSPKNRDAEFLGWFNNAGEKVSSAKVFTVDSVKQDYNLTAKFTVGTTPKDLENTAAITKALQEDGYYAPLFEKAIANTGNRALLAKMVQKAKNGEDLTVVGLGGSITQGAGVGWSEDQHYTRYINRVGAYLQKQFPSIKVNVINAGIGATSSLLGKSRMQAQVLSHNPDLVIVDFTTNDGSNDERYNYSYEAIIRTLLEQQVATVAVMFGPVKSTEYNNGVYIKSGNCVNVHLPILQYYDVPVINYYDATWDYLDSNGDGQNTAEDIAQWTALEYDYIHPNFAGHLLSANAIGYYLQTVIDGVDQIDKTVPQVPQALFRKATASYLNYTMYTTKNIGGLITKTEKVKTGVYGNVDANTITDWKPWLIEKGGYIELTLNSLESLTLMHVTGAATVKNIDGKEGENITLSENSSVRVTLHGQGILSDSTSGSGGVLNWASGTYTESVTGPITLRIECLSGTYCLTSILISQ